jgi:hypothetical protein
MTKLARTSLIALALAGAPLAAQTAPPGGFRLPTPTPTPTDIQGPVDPDRPILTRPRDTAPTPTPTPRPTPVPTAAPPQPAVVTPTPRPVASPTNSSLPPRFTPPAAPTAAESAAVSQGAAVLPTSPADSTVLPPAPLPTASTPAAAPVEDEGIPGWLYALGGLLVGAGAVGAFMWRRRQSADAVPAEIERPRVVPAAGVPLAAEPPLAATGPQLTIEARALRMSRSMVYATLSYEVLVTNRGGQPLTDVRLGADLVTAHARIPTDQQLADPLVPLSPVKTYEQLDPGQSVTFAGELRLAVNEIRPIPHGKAVVYVPLLRVRAEAQDLIPVARTFVVGLPGGMNQRLQPFRLDEMPQTYRTVSQHALD